jgi:hypothetical protein
MSNGNDLTILSTAAKQIGHDVRTLALEAKGKVDPDATLVRPNGQRLALYRQDRIAELAALLAQAQAKFENEKRLNKKL